MEDSKLYLVTKELVKGPWTYSVYDVLSISDKTSNILNTNNGFNLHTTFMVQFKTDTKVLQIDTNKLFVDEYVQINDLEQIKRMFANHEINDFLQTIKTKDSPIYINFSNKTTSLVKPEVYINRLEWLVDATIETKGSLQEAINDILTKAQQDIEELIISYEKTNNP